MTSTRFFCAILAAILLATAGLVVAHPAPRKISIPSHVADFAHRSQLPSVMLWAWERPEDLRAIDPSRVGVAFLARTVFLVGDSVSIRPRLQPLRLPVRRAPGETPGLDTALVAVVRVEVSRETSSIHSHATSHATSSAASAPASASPSLSSRQIEQAANAIAAAAQLPGLAGLQIDFDATASQRKFYRRLISQVHEKIPPSLPLSITALASWCIGDNWLNGLPIDDAVPMLFRMGAGAREVALHLDAGGDFRAPACRQSLGVSTDERISNLPKDRRLYIFSPRAWTPGTAQLATQMVRP